MTIQERFDCDVKRAIRLKNGCLVWTRSQSGNPVGYGQFFLRRENGVQRFKGAHRYMYELKKGPIPAGMHVLHSCDNRACIEIKHLWLGSNHDNIKDKTKKNRHWQGKLSAKQRKQLANDFARGRSIVQLARQFNVTSCCVQTALRKAISGPGARVKEFQ